MPVKINLYEVMAKRDIRTIADLSERSGLSRKAISKILNGQTTRIDLDTLYKLCKTLDCKVNDLIIYDRNEVKS